MLNFPDGHIETDQLDGLHRLEQSDASSEGQGLRQVKKARLKGSKPTTLSFYKGLEKDVLVCAKENLKLYIYTQNAFPDQSKANKFVQHAYKEAVEQMGVSPEDDLGKLHRHLIHFIKGNFLSSS